MLCQRVSDLRAALNIVPDNKSTKEKISILLGLEENSSRR